MAVLSDADRFGIWGDIMRLSSAARSGIDLTKMELRTAVNAVDNWIDSNVASYNSALPTAARTALTAKQKARLLAVVVDRRLKVT